MRIGKSLTVSSRWWALGLMLGLAPAAVAAEDEAPMVSLRSFVLAKDVVDRQPVEPTDTFSRAGDPKIVAYLDVLNAPRTETTLTVHWTRPDGADRFPPTSIEIPGYRRWRTWAHMTPRRIGSGEHLCLVKDATGREIQRLRFRVVD